MADGTTEDLGDLEIAHVGGLRYRVLNDDPSDHDRTTAYEVHIGELSCNCEYGQQGPSGPTICDHLRKAIIVAPKQQSIETVAFDNLIDLWSEAREAVAELEELRNVAQANQNARAASAAAQDDESDESPPADPVEQIRDMAREAGVPVGDGVKIYEHDQYGSIQVEKVDHIDDAEFEALKEFTSDDVWSYDQNSGTNYVPPDQISEVLK